MSGPTDEGMTDPPLRPSRFGAGFTVGGSEGQPSRSAPQFVAPEPPAPTYPPPVPPAPPMYYSTTPNPYAQVQNPYPVLVPVAYVPAQRTNGFAVAAFVCPLVLCALFPLGIIFGHIALSQISSTGEGGKGLAIAGLVISYLFAAFAVVVFGLPFLGLAVS